MVRQIVWTEKAQKERIAILTFLNTRNKSSVYSKELNGLIKDSLNLISKQPLIGKLTNKKNVRVRILKNYFIVYEITDKEIVVLSFWDSRQNPDNLTEIIN